MRIRTFLAATVVGLGIHPALAETQSPGQCTRPIHLDGEGALKNAFNEAKGSVRLLFVIDPICPGCLQGAAQISRHLFTPETNVKNMKVFVVHMPVIGGKEMDAQRTCKILSDPRVTHYWDGTGEFGRTLSRGLALKSNSGGEAYAWDVWLAYGPETEWTRVDPPRPAKFMHQLMALYKNPAYEFLDASEFVASVKQLSEASQPR